MSKKVAVILSGCGYLDGAEIRESVLTLLELDRAGAQVEIFAPNELAFHTVNHKRAQPEGDARNILDEAARIARGKVAPLGELDQSKFDAVVFPGGFGVAKNLCTFAFKGAEGIVTPAVQSVIEQFYSASKPIGAICIAPALIALALKDKGIELTIGNDPDTASALRTLGAVHKNCAPNEIAVDLKNKVVSTPAYMYDDAGLAKISEGIAACIKKVIELA